MDDGEKIENWTWGTFSTNYGSRRNDTCEMLVRDNAIVKKNYMKIEQKKLSKHMKYFHSAVYGKLYFYSDESNIA